MSKFVIDVKEEAGGAPPAPAAEVPGPGRKLSVLKVLTGIAVFAVLVILAAAVVGFVYWQGLKDTPQYSLALLVEAARNGNEAEVERFVDVDSVVEGFVPQVVEKAGELYGRGLPPEVVESAVKLAQPLIPVVKQRAKARLPELLREKLAGYEDVPFWAMVLGADRYLEIEVNGEMAEIRGEKDGRRIELTMRKNGDRWMITGVRDEELALSIARKIGQELILLAKEAGKRRIEDLGKDLGVDDIGDLLKQAEEIFR